MRRVNRHPIAFNGRPPDMTSENPEGGVDRDGPRPLTFVLLHSVVQDAKQFFTKLPLRVHRRWLSNRGPNSLSRNRTSDRGAIASPASTSFQSDAFDRVERKNAAHNNTIACIRDPKSQEEPLPPIKFLDDRSRQKLSDKVQVCETQWNMWKERESQKACSVR